LAVLGPFEAVSHLGHLYSALRLLVNEARARRPRLAILLDFPDFNLRLAVKLKALGIPVLYLISPQVWAWRSGRVKQMQKTIDRMLVILPFEKDFYAERGVQVDYVGHPLVDRVRVSKSRSEFFHAHKLDESVPTVSLLPGSRTSEIRFHLPTLLQAARWLHWQRPVQFLLPAASSLHGSQIRKILTDSGGPPLSLIEYDTYNAVGHSDLAVVSSGTATLETALLGTPLITVFKISNFTWIVGQYLVRVPFYSLVNLIAGREVVPELFQSAFTAERLHAEMVGLLDQPDRLKHVRMGLASVKQKLGAGGAIHKAAECILPWLQDSAVVVGGPR
jgi:lipid-A-disaccharide synthase